MYALERWDDFDTWCLLKGVKKPWKKPGYQFYNLVLTFLREGRDEEGLSALENTLKDVDFAPHPFAAEAVSVPTPVRRTVDNVVYDERLAGPDDELPIEERKRREAQAQGKAYKVPDWWKGEEAAYSVAKSAMMGGLPKNIGQSVQ